MVRVLARRIATAFFTLLLVTLVVFLLLHLIPGDPLEGEAEAPTHRLPAERQAELRALYHLDEPFHRQYLLWIGDVLRGDLGRSFHDRRPVTERIGERLGVTLALNAPSLALMLVRAVPLGTAAAARPGSRLDRAAGATTYALYSIPVFWAGVVLQALFSVHLDWLPLYGIESDGAATLAPLPRLLDRVLHLLLPVACLTYGGLAYVSRFVRANLLENASGETARAARARGLSVAGVLLRHGSRQSAVPILTLVGFLLPRLVGGSVIVETVFALPGMGRLFFEAVLGRDVPVLMGLTLVSSAAILVGTAFADLAYSVADPRVRRA